MCDSESRKAGAIIEEIEFEVRNWDQSRHIGLRELAERIYREFSGCGMPTIPAIKGDIS
jgi:hypothetical protein